MQKSTGIARKFDSLSRKPGGLVAMTPRHHDDRCRSGIRRFWEVPAATTPRHLSSMTAPGSTWMRYALESARGATGDRRAGCRLCARPHLAAAGLRDIREPAPPEPGSLSHCCKRDHELPRQSPCRAATLHCPSWPRRPARLLYRPLSAEIQQVGLHTGQTTEESRDPPEVGWSVAQRSANQSSSLAAGRGSEMK